ncbi:aspartate--tRNA ligase [bacterium]|nr:aspartate--tRNA ligase [bacterium]
MKKFNNNDFTEKDLDKEVSLFGWVNKRRDMGGVIFVDLRDRSGIIQVVFNRGFLKQEFEIAESLKNEYCIKVTGKIILRDEEMINPKIATGKIELMASDLEILSTSDALPFNVYDDEDVNESVGLKYRYLDLRRENLKNNIILRHKIIKSAREYLNNLDFLEIETPILCKSTPEGARDYLVPSRINKGSFYALPQSPQIFKQLLMVSGFEKYYQVAKCFRDEDLRADRQPEFTQIDLEMSFAQEEDVWNVCEGMIKKIVKDTKNIELDDFPRMTYQDAMENYGSDKPDTRFDMKLLDLTEILKNTRMNVFRQNIENGGIAKCLIVRNNGDKYSRTDIDHLIDFTRIYGAKGMAWLKYDNDQFNGVIAKNLEDEKLEEIKNTYDVKNNDLILIVADKPKVVYAALGALRIKIAKTLDIIPKDKLNFVWITDFPFFEYSETEKRWKAEHNPFTMIKDINTINEPEKCISRSYDLVVNGYELASGGVRNHKKDDLAKVFKALGISDEEAEKRFGFMLEAFKYGVPPHAGIAPGVERLVMVLSGTDDIKDVIAFPKTQSAQDLMSEAPSDVSLKQLKELGIKIEKDDEK